MLSIYLFAELFNVEFKISFSFGPHSQQRAKPMIVVKGKTLLQTDQAIFLHLKIITNQNIPSLSFSY